MGCRICQCQHLKPGDLGSQLCPGLAKVALKRRDGRMTLEGVCNWRTRRSNGNSVVTMLEIVKASTTGK